MSGAIVAGSGLFDVDTGLVYELSEVRCADLMPSTARNGRVVVVVAECPHFGVCSSCAMTSGQEV